MTISPDDDGRASGSPVAEVTPRPLARASIVTPGDWTELDLDPNTRHTSVRRAVRQAVIRSRGLAPDAVALIRMLDRTCKQAIESGAFYCASRVIEDTTDGVLVATVVMQLQQPETVPLAAVPNLSVAQRCVVLAAVIKDDADWSGANVGVVMLPFVGPAVRLRVEDGGTIVQYIAPLLGRYTALLVTFTCTCPPYAAVMTELFDSMAQSVALHYD
jgi:hypothetical protein